jgi:adenine/guanine phosphoribosyltransferase-like PRPP-binding protein
VAGERETYPVKIAGVERHLPLFEVAPGVRIAIFNLLGDTEVVEAGAKALQTQLEGAKFDLVVTPEAKSIPLAHALAVRAGTRYIVLRKIFKPYMGEALSAETVSITTGEPQVLYLDEKDRSLIHGRRVVLLDDVISTGSTLMAMRKLTKLAGAVVVAEAAVFTEGDPQAWKDIICLGHLPVFGDS